MKALLALLILAAPAAATTAPPYFGTTINTTTGKATQQVSGVINVAASSPTADSPTIVLNGATQSILAGSSVTAGAFFGDASHLTNALVGSSAYVVSHALGTITVYQPTENTDAARGTALQNAFLAAGASDYISVAPGDFLLSTVLLPKQNQSVKLNGSHLYHTNASTDIFKVSGADSVSIVGPAFLEGAGLTAGTTNSEAGIRVTGTLDNFNAENLVIRNFKGAGILLESTWVNNSGATQWFGNGVIKNVQSSSNTWGMYVAGGSEYWRITHSLLRGNTTGLYDGGGNLGFSDNDVTQNVAGVFIDGTAGNGGHGSFTANMINHNIVFGVYFYRGTLGMTFTGNHFAGKYNTGGDNTIYLDGTYGVTINGGEFLAPMTIGLSGSTPGYNAIRNVWFRGSEPTITGSASQISFLQIEGCRTETSNITTQGTQYEIYASSINSSFKIGHLEVQGVGNGSSIHSNSYYNGVNMARRATGTSERIAFGDSAVGSIDFQRAASGVAGSTFQFSNSMSIDPSGQVGINVSTAFANTAELYLGGAPTLFLRAGPYFTLDGTGQVTIASSMTATAFAGSGAGLTNISIDLSTVTTRFNSVATDTTTLFNIKASTGVNSSITSLNATTIGISTVSSTARLNIKSYGLTESTLRAGDIEVLSNGANNSAISDNVYYSGGFKTRETGAGAQIYFGATEPGSFDFRMSPAISTPSAVVTMTNYFSILSTGTIYARPYPSNGAAACWGTGNKMGHCTSVVDVSGLCTCVIP